MKNILILMFILISTFLYAEGITPIPDLKMYNSGKIEEIEDLTPPENTNFEEISNINDEIPNYEFSEMSDEEFEAIPTTKDYAGEVDYAKELDLILSEYKYSPKETENYYPNDIFRPALGDINLETKKFTFLKDGFIADDEIYIINDYYYLSGKNFSFVEVGNKFSGNAENIILTTCENHKHPHWSIHADQIQVYKSNKNVRLLFKNVRLKLGKISVAWLPVWSHDLKMSKKQAKNLVVIPFLTYRNSTGLGIKFHPTLFESDRFYLDTYFKWTMKKQFQYNFYGNIALDRPFGDNPFVDDVSVSKMVDDLNKFNKLSPYKNDIDVDYKKRAKWTAKIGHVYKDLDSTMDGTDVEIYKLIDTKLTYHLNPIGKVENMDVLSLIEPTISYSWTKEKDKPYFDEYISKNKVSAVIPYAMGKYKNMNVQPFLKFDWNNYKDHSSYKAYSAGIDLSRFYEDNSYWIVRYIAAKEQGDPIFEFDSINYERGLMAGGIKEINNKYLMGAWFGHNFNKKKTYRLGCMVGFKEDCFWTSIGYDFKQKKIYWALDILGF